jgi:hypothetical protein
MEFIWYLEDAFEQKDMGKFFSLVSFDFKKDFLKFKDNLYKITSQQKSLKLYIHFIDKRVDSKSNIYSYDICWIKQFTGYMDEYCYKELGMATIALKASGSKQDLSFRLYDISGESPFV